MTLKIIQISTGISFELLMFYRSSVIRLRCLAVAVGVSYAEPACLCKLYLSGDMIAVFIVKQTYYWGYFF